MKQHPETQQTLEDILFEHRNKTYGAFDLRQRYARHLGKASFIGTSLVAFGLVAPTLYAKFMPPHIHEHITLANPTSLPLPPTENIEKPPVIPQEPMPIETMMHLPPKITIDDLVPENAPPLHTQELCATL